MKDREKKMNNQTKWFKFWNSKNKHEDDAQRILWTSRQVHDESQENYIQAEELWSKKLAAMNLIIFTLQPFWCARVAICHFPVCEWASLSVAFQVNAYGALCMNMCQLNCLCAPLLYSNVVIVDIMDRLLCVFMCKSKTKRTKVKTVNV